MLRLCFLSLWANSTSISEIWVVSFEYVRFLVSQRLEITGAATCSLFFVLGLNVQM